MSDCRKCADLEWCNEHEECGLFKPRKMTNADHIRIMTDEELAVWIVNRTEGNDFDGYEEHIKSWLDWLKLEV